MKKKELQRFSKEVFAAAVVSLSVAGTAIPAQAASTQDASVGVVKTQEQSDETEAQIQAEEAADAAVTDTEETTAADSAEAAEQGQESEATAASAESQAGEDKEETEENGQNTASEEETETDNTDSQPEQSEENAEDQTEDTVSDSKAAESGTQEKVSCWETDEEGNKHYYDENGTMVRWGVKEIDGKTYVFDYDGNLVISEAYFDYSSQKYYYADENGEAVTGWHYLDHYYFSNWGGSQEEGWYYYGADGAVCTGVTEIDGKTYYFDYSGVALTDRVADDGKYLYYFGADGMAEEKTELKDGWVKFRNKYYYVQNGEILKSQWLELSGKKYYLKENGEMASGEGWYVENQLYYFKEDGSLRTGWIRNFSDGWTYYDKTGTMKTGLFEVDGKLYYGGGFEGTISVLQDFYVDGVLYHADADGVCTKVTENGWTKDGRYLENGKVVTGWKQISGNWYYFNPETGIKLAYKNTFYEKEIDGKTYCFDKDGVMQKGWIREENRGEVVWKYAKVDGRLLQTEWLKTGNTWYYFVNSKMVTGVVNIGGVNHLFDTNGVWKGEVSKQTNGWKQVGSDWYYLENGKLVKSDIKTIQNKKYIFDANGKMLKNQEETLYTEKGPVIYYLGNSGAAYISQWRLVPGNRWKYYDADGNGNLSGWKQIKKVWYYFDSLNNNVAAVQDVVEDGKVYHFNSDGSYTGKSESLKNGWKRIDGYWHYYENGTQITSKLKTINGKKYYFDYEGKMYFGKTEYVNGKTYLFANDGHIITKEGWYGTVYVNSAGEAETNKTHTTDYLSLDHKTLYLVDPDTHQVVQEVSATKGGWVQGKCGKWFYSDKTRFLTNGGSLTTTKVKIGNKVYGFDINGEMVTNDWHSLLEGSGYFDKSGVLQMNGWCDGSYFVDGYTVAGAQKIDGKEYYFRVASLGKDARSFAVVNTAGLFDVNGTLYYYDGNGNRQKVSLKEGWNKLPNGDYCYLKNGKLQRSPVVINGKTYGFDNATGLMIRNSFCYMQGNRYYFNNSGEMVKNGWIKSDGNEKASYDVDGERYDNFGDSSFRAGYYYADAAGHILKGSYSINGKTYYFDYDGRWIE